MAFGADADRRSVLAACVAAAGVSQFSEREATTVTKQCATVVQPGSRMTDATSVLSGPADRGALRRWWTQRDP
ncbi:hypothetical protein BH23ACT2_BH23ACT2_30970 [soil metagenome]